MLAKHIQKKIGSDIFKIETDKIYPNEYYACTDEAKNEVKNNIFPDVLNMPNNFDKYDTIYIGHPVWWDNIPNVVIGFLKKYNWKDKTIYQFCTHEGSGMANGNETLKNICKDTIIKPYFEVRGYMCQDIQKYEVDKQIDDWLNNK